MADRTYWDSVNEKNVLDHEIFDAIIKEISSAETFLILDLFLWNQWIGKTEKKGNFRRISEDLTNAIISKRVSNPHMPIVIIIDPINSFYGNQLPYYFDSLKAIGIPIVTADVSILPESNWLYSKQTKFWSNFSSKEFNNNNFKFFPNLITSKGDPLSLSQYLKSLHFKANHRKVLISGYKENSNKVIIGGFNASDGKYLDSNIAVMVTGAVSDYIARSEIELINLSILNEENLYGNRVHLENALRIIDSELMKESDFKRFLLRKNGVKYLSEAAFGRSLISELDASATGTEIDISAHYLSDRKLIKSLKSAAKRGTKIRLLLDQNKYSYGYIKTGIPNRSVADELMQLDEVDSIQVHWVSSDTKGQHQVNSVRIYDENRDLLYIGSSNFTKRSLWNYNLESNLLFKNIQSINNEFDEYFNSIWSNSFGYEESYEYKALKNPKWLQYFRFIFYRLEEITNFSSR